MSDESGAQDAYRERVRVLLEDAVRDELHVMSMGEVVRTASGEVIQLPDEVLDHLAWAVAIRLDYAFSFRWDPDWVAPGAPHIWSEDGRNFARCTACLAESGSTESHAAARSWLVEHHSSAHGG
jgi:hypothetical protein